eukprot:UN31608
MRYVDFVNNYAQKHMNENTFKLNGDPDPDENEPKPQFGGVALRAISLLKFSEYVFNNPAQFVDNYQNILWRVIYVDLKYLKDNKVLSSYDLWGEVFGDHYAVQMLIRSALTFGVDLFEQVSESFAENEEIENMFDEILEESEIT